MKKITKIIWIIALLAMVPSANSQEKNTQVETKPLTKMLLFKWKENVTKIQQSEMIKLFEELVMEVEGFDHLEVEELRYSSRFETSFVLKFDSEEAEERYRFHPKHQLVADLGTKLVRDFTEFKY